MKVKDLIEHLKDYDPEKTVCFGTPVGSIFEVTEDDDETIEVDAIGNPTRDVVVLNGTKIGSSL